MLIVKAIWVNKTNKTFLKNFVADITISDLV